MPNQHVGLSFLAKAPTATPSGPQVPSHHLARVQSAVGQARTYQRTGGGRYAGQMPFNPRHGAYPANGMTVYPPHRGGPHSLHPGHNVRQRPSLCYIHL
jgi:hypothetical protein